MSHKVLSLEQWGSCNNYVFGCSKRPEICMCIYLTPLLPTLYYSTPFYLIGAHLILFATHSKMAQRLFYDLATHITVSQLPLPAVTLRFNTLTAVASAKLPFYPAVTLLLIPVTALTLQLNYHSQQGTNNSEPNQAVTTQLNFPSQQ